MVIVLHDLFILKQKSEVVCEPVEALVFTRPCINLCIYGSALASFTRTWSQICTPSCDFWISTAPGLKLACISTLPEIILLLTSTQTYINLAQSIEILCCKTPSITYVPSGHMQKFQ